MTVPVQFGNARHIFHPSFTWNPCNGSYPCKKYYDPYQLKIIFKPDRKIFKKKLFPNPGFDPIQFTSNILSEKKVRKCTGMEITNLLGAWQMPLGHQLPKTENTTVHLTWTLEPQGRGYSPEKIPFFMPWPFPKTPISEFVSFSRPYIHLKSQILGKFAFQSLKIGEKLSSYA